VKSKRNCCAPNTAFTCNLIEIAKYLKSNWRNKSTVLFRCAAHLIPHDAQTPALKICLNKESRKCIIPRTSVLDPYGVYVLKPPDRAVIKNSNSENFLVPEGSLGIDMFIHFHVNGFVCLYLHIDIVYIYAFITVFICMLSSTDNS
jgi:hypothetical protein